jgi:predicted TIM-barrel fold metal-dependent hydrolase
MIVDVHIHPFCQEITVTPSLPEAMRRMFFETRSRQVSDADAVALAQAAFLNRTLEDIIGDMDDAGIDRACIVAMDLSTHYGVKLGTNEDVARMAAAHPDRLIPFASVDPSMGRLAVDGLIHAVEELGCRGLKLVPPVQHFDFSDPKHHPLWEAALDLDILVWTHTAHQKSHPDSDARLGHPMLVEPVTLKYPELKIVLGHCGFPWVWETWSLVARRPNVYVDISAYPSLYNHFPWDAYSKADVETRVLFATDYPLLSFEETRDALDAVSISEDFRSKILGENAAVLLGL